MRVLGVNAIFHDPSAALVVDGTDRGAPRRRSGSRAASTASARCRSRPGSCPSRPCAGASTRRGCGPQDLDAVAYSFDPALAKPAEDMGLDDPWDPLRRMLRRGGAGVPRRPRCPGSTGAGALRAPPRGPRRVGRARRARSPVQVGRAACSSSTAGASRPATSPATTRAAAWTCSPPRRCRTPWGCSTSR